MRPLRGLVSDLPRLPPGVAVVIACWAVQQLPELPPAGWGPALLCLGLLACAAHVVCCGMPAGGVDVERSASPEDARGRARLRAGRAATVLRGYGGLLCGVTLAAGGWALCKADAHLADRLFPELEGVDLVVSGIVVDMPQATEFGQRFRFRIEACPGHAHACPVQRVVRLAWTRPHPASGRLPGTAQVGRATAVRAREPVTLQANEAISARANDPLAAQADGPVAGQAHDPAGVHAGQRWRFTVRLKRPHAPLNPGLFDAELRALQENIAGNGSVRNSARIEQPRLLDAFVFTPGTLVESVREALRARILAVLSNADPAARGVVVALVVGDQAAIPSRWWEVLNRTGIGHLVSISGLHITMLAGLAAAGTGLLWRSRAIARCWGGTPIAHWLPLPHARWIFGVVVAFAYSALAGWGIPAQRTCWMLAVAGAAKLSGRAAALPGVLATAAAVVCVLDPWAPMAAGFWLSFGAVAGIVWFGSAGRRPQPAPSTPVEPASGAVLVPQVSAPPIQIEPISTVPSPTVRGRSTANPIASIPTASDPTDPVLPESRRMRVMQALHTCVAEVLKSQIAASLVLLPMGALFFSSLSLVGPLANLVSIPVVSGLVTPLALAGTAVALVWDAGGAVMLSCAAWLTSAVLTFVMWLDLDGAGAVALAAPSVVALSVAVAGCVLLLAPLHVPARGLALCALLPLLSASVPAPPAGAIRVTALDVGQGAAILIETADGRLLFDAGPRFGTENDAGARLVVPYLHTQGIRTLTRLVVSHLDLDHSGGALSVLRNIAVDEVVSSLSDEHEISRAAHSHVPCRQGEGWAWGEVEFLWLHPDGDEQTSRRIRSNARSCVLMVRSPAGRVLLTGDIEAGQERRLIDEIGGDALRAEVLFAPHHGSATSSTAAFLSAVSPRLAVFQVGYRNRFGHPDARVLERYRTAGIEILRTDASGAVRVLLRPGAPPLVETARARVPRYWRIHPAGAHRRDVGVALTPEG